MSDYGDDAGGYGRDEGDDEFYDEDDGIREESPEPDAEDDHGGAAPDQEDNIDDREHNIVHSGEAESHQGPSKPKTDADRKIPDDKRTTTPYMTKYERARVLGTRALQISMNAPVLVDLEGETDPLQIAIMELNQKKIPLIGSVNAFGVFQTYYESNPHWTESPSNISWIGSVQAFLLLMVGVFTGPVYDAGYFRHLIITGAFLIPLGFQMTSLASEYWQTMLSQGITIGLGSGCIFVPSVAILPQYFTTKKALANGIAASGSSVGGVIYPIVFRRLLPQIGFPWATRVLGFMSLVTLWFSVWTMKPRYLPKGRRKMFDWSAFREIPYLCFTLGMFFAFIGFYGPIYYIQSYALAKQLTSVDFSFYLLPILNSASVPGRILPNFIADRIGPFNVLIPCALITSILAFYWIGITNLAGTVLFALLYGFFSGGFVSLPPVAITTLTEDMRKLAQWLCVVTIESKIDARNLGREKDINLEGEQK
ncbi:hypothetical protein DV737_g3999, partial [Chaetothyriales sp. CBS 132003]